LVSAVRNIGSTVGTAAESVVDWFTRAARGGVQDPNPPSEQPTEDETRGSSAGDIFDWFERDRNRDRDRPGGDDPDSPA
jgi:hypothetical protein